MHCGQCGKSIDADSKFCIHCGAKVTAGPANAAAMAPAPTPAPAPKPSGAAADGGAAGAHASAASAASEFGAAASGAAAAASAAFDRVDTRGIVARARNILMAPRSEWPVISSEAKSTSDVLVGYVAPLAALAAIAGGLGMMLFGFSVPLIGTIRTGVGATLAHIVTQFVFTFVSLYLIAFIIDALAPTFNGQKDSARAMKVAAYSFTPAWVAGLLTLLPALGPIAALLGLYGFYLLYLGLPVMMRSPQEKSVAYTVVVVICAIVVTIVMTALVGVVGAMFATATPGLAGSALSRGDRSADEAATVLSSVLGGKSDADKARMKDAISTLTKMGEDAKNAEKAAKATGNDPSAAAANAVDLNAALAAVGTMASGGKDVKPVDFHALKDMLPERVGALPRRDASGQSGEAAGMKGSSAAAHYGDGNASVTLEVADIGSLSALAGLATKFNPNSEKETDTGYERTRTVNGQIVHEKYDRSSKSGEFGVMVGNRFLVTASGSNVGEDTLLAAVKSIDVGKLAALSK